MKQRVGQLGHHSFEAAAEFKRGDHCMQRVAVARIRDILQNFDCFLFEFDEGGRGAIRTRRLASRTASRRIGIVRR